MTDPKLDLLMPEDSAVILIDHQPMMFFGTESRRRDEVINYAALMAKTARLFRVPVVLSTVAAKTFAGPIFSQIRTVLPEVEPYDRSNMNAWEDSAFRAAVEATGRKRLIFAGLWTEICVLFPVLSALKAGYEVYFVVDASAGRSERDHEAGVQRMIQAGAVPLTAHQLLVEFHRDWARVERYEAVVGIIRQHVPGFGIGNDYADAMVHGKASQSRGAATPVLEPA